MFSSTNDGNEQVEFGYIKNILPASTWLDLMALVSSLNHKIPLQSKQRHDLGLGSVWPDKNNQMSIKVAQKWFH